MKLILKPNFFLFLLVMVLFAGCQSRPEIRNADLDHYQYGKFVNLHKPLYGYGYHQSELDELEYLNPDEIERKHYTFIHAYEPAKQINRTKNYDPAVFQVRPEVASLARYGNMDVCLMPISAYFFRAVHLAPEDALQASEDLGCRAFIPWGYGTFILGHEHVHEPPRRLEEVQRRMNPTFSIHVLKMGETWVLEEAFRKYRSYIQN